MTRRASVIALLLGLGIIASAQSLPIPTARDQINQEKNTAVAPTQMRRAEPPPANATVVELEARGDELREQKFFTDALDYYEAAIARMPQNATLHNKKGIAALQMQRFDLAKKEFERAVKLQKDLPEAYNNLGVVFYTHKKFKNAIKNYRKAIELRETSASFHSNLGTAYFARKEFEKANGEYLRALELDPEIFERHSSGGVSAHLSSPEDRAHYDYFVAKMYASRGDAEHSLQYLRKAMEEGYSKIENVFKDAEFAALRKDPRFNDLMNARPQAIPQ